MTWVAFPPLIPSNPGAKSPSRITSSARPAGRALLKRSSERWRACEVEVGGWDPGPTDDARGRAPDGGSPFGADYLPLSDLTAAPASSPEVELQARSEREVRQFTAHNPVAASQPDSTRCRWGRLSDSRSRCRRGPTFPSRRHDLPHRAGGDGPLRSECSCRSGRTPCGARDWPRLETAIPSAPSRSPSAGPRSGPYAMTYASTSTSDPWTRTAYRATPRGAGGPSTAPVLML